MVGLGGFCNFRLYLAIGFEIEGVRGVFWKVFTPLGNSPMRDIKLFSQRGNSAASSAAEVVNCILGFDFDLH